MSKSMFEYLQKMITEINYIVNNHQGIVATLEDREGKPAVLMCLLQIGETLNKIDVKKHPKLREAQQGAYSVRNFIAHDYEGVNMALIENIVRNLLPELNTIIADYKNNIN